MRTLVGHSKIIHELAMTRAKDYLKSERLLFAALIEIDLDRTFEVFGETHLSPYCVKYLKLSKPMAEVFVRVVRKSHHVPLLASAVMSGEISLTNAKVIASIITPENQEEWIAKARDLTKDKLEREVSKASGVETKTLKLEMPFGDVDNLKRAQEILSTKLGRSVSREETIGWFLEDGLERHDPLRKADRTQVHSVERQVDRRDRCECQFILQDGTICGEKKWLHHHHIKPRSQGGPDTLENLTTLCSSHHRMVHAH